MITMLSLLVTVLCISRLVWEIQSDDLGGVNTTTSFTLRNNQDKTLLHTRRLTNTTVEYHNQPLVEWAKIELVAVTNDYQFNERLTPEEDALKAYKDVCGNNMCNESLRSFQKTKWTCIICPPCSCRDDCHVFGTCCPDKAVVKANLTQTYQKVREDEQPRVSCERMSPKPCDDSVRIDRSNVVKVIMVSRCPVGYATDINKLLCEGKRNISDVMQTFAVSSRKDGFTYRNIYCSRCHRVPDSDVEFWKPQIKCDNVTAVAHARSEAQLWEAIVATKGCCARKSTPPEGISQEPCWWDSDVIARCNVTGQLMIPNEYIERMCSQTLVSVVIVRGRTYKNIYCASCNGKLYFTGNGCSTNSITRGTYSFAALLDFNPRKAIQETRRDEGKETKNNSTLCREHEVRHPVTEECTKIECADRFLYDAPTQSCKTMFDEVTGLGYKLNLRLVPNDDEFVTTPDILEQKIRESIIRSMMYFYPFSIEPLTQVIEIKNNSESLPRSGGTPINVTAINLSINLRTAKPSNQEEFENSLDAIIYKDQMISIDSDRLLKFKTFHIDDCAGNYFTNAKSTISSYLYFEKYEMSSVCRRFCKYSSDYVDYKDRLSCPFISINRSQVSLSNKLNNSVNITIGNYRLRLVNASDCKVCGNTFKICVSSLKNAKLIKSRNPTEQLRDETIANDRALIIVSIVATTISLVCLLLTFITYCIFKELRTLPGLNTMALIANLFAAQIVFQMGIKPTGNDAVCRFLGIFIHYLWMSSFAWMAVCAFHMFTIFRSIFMLKTGEVNRKRFISYILTANLLPIVLPLICVLYHYWSVTDTNFGYGGWICFLNTAEDIAYFFAVPLAFVLLLNTIFYVATVISIRKVPVVSSGSRRNRNQMCIYVKMSVLTGLTWTIGLIAAAFNSTVLWYLFTVINGSQGVFIFVVYVAKRRTINMYKQTRDSQKSKTESSSRKTPKTQTVTCSTVKESTAL